jgi:hypothetical protein
MNIFDLPVLSALLAAASAALAALQKKWAKNPERLQRETMALYASAKVSPFAGCLPVLLQAPVLTLVYAIFASPTIAGAPNELLGHTLFGAPLGMHLTGLFTGFAPSDLVLVAVIVAIAVVAWFSRRMTQRLQAANPPAAATPALAGQAGLAKALSWAPFVTVIAACFVPLAAALSLAVVGAALAGGQPGGPLYGGRVWLESLTLPADAANRADAEIVRLEARLAEIGVAAARGDASAIADALAAYGEIADEALAGTAGDAAALDRIRAALGRHLGVLGRVAAQLPGQAAAQIEANIERAIAHSNAAIDRIESRANPPTGKPASGGATETKTPKPETKTPKPETNTPKPTSAQGAATPPQPATDPPAGPPSARPGKTPPAHPDDEDQ